MKKLLVILALPLFLISCGDSNDGTASSEEAAAYLGDFYEDLFDTEGVMPLAVSTETIPAFPCPEGGKINYSINGTTLAMTFDNCTKQDPMCSTSEDVILNGTLNLAVDSIDSPNSANITGTLNSTGLITETCGVNVNFSISTEGEMSDATGSLCGYTIEELEALEATTICEIITAS